ncbi:hypothetical protein JW905_13045 [bacterium]|nr:hypothetical protein [candidate division CSSED10-310 bacterium]
MMKSDAYTRWLGSVQRRLRWEERRKELEWTLPGGRNWLGISIEDGRVVAALCRISKEGFIFPFAYHKVPYGESGDFIPSITRIESAIQLATEPFRKKQAIPFDHVVLGVPSWILGKGDYHQEMTITPPDAEINREHVRILEGMIQREVPANYVVVDTIHKSFMVNGNKKVKDPIGMPADRLGLHAHLVVTERALLKGLLGCVKLLNKPVEALASPFVSGWYGALSSRDMDAGVVLIDVGELNTCCTFLHRGKLFDTAIIKSGAQEITSTIAHNIGSDYRSLENSVEDRKGYFLSDDNSRSENLRLPVPLAGENNMHSVSMTRMNYLTSLACEELVEKIGAALNINSGRLEFAAAGVVLIGENYLSLRGIRDTFKDRFNVKLRLGYPRYISGVSMNGINDPGYVKVLGLLRNAHSSAQGPHPFLQHYYETIAQFILKEGKKKVSTRLHRFIDRYL